MAGYVTQEVEFALMPIKDQVDRGVGFPAMTGSNEHLYASYDWNKLRSGTLCHFVDQGGTHIPTLIGNVDVTRNPVEISVNQLVNGRVTTLCNVPYNDTTKTPYSWHFPSDG